MKLKLPNSEESISIYAGLLKVAFHGNLIIIFFFITTYFILIDIHLKLYKLENKVELVSR